MLASMSLFTSSRHGTGQRVVAALLLVKVCRQLLLVMPRLRYWRITINGALLTASICETPIDNIDEMNMLFCLSRENTTRASRR